MMEFEEFKPDETYYYVQSLDSMSGCTINRVFFVGKTARALVFKYTKTNYSILVRKDEQCNLFKNKHEAIQVFIDMQNNEINYHKSVAGILTDNIDGLLKQLDE